MAILQLSAVCNDKVFDAYVEPPRKCYIHPEASKVTSLRIEKGRLTYRHRPVDTKPMGEVLRQFIGWLRQLRRPILMGHNIKCFDNPLLYRDLKKFGCLDEFRDICGGFVDTLELFKVSLFGFNETNCTA